MHSHLQVRATSAKEEAPAKGRVHATPFTPAVMLSGQVSLVSVILEPHWGSINV